jgi:hypothetical protein
MARRKSHGHADKLDEALTLRERIQEALGAVASENRVHRIRDGQRIRT